MKTTKLSSKNQITLPQSLLRALRLKKGSRVILEPRKEGVLLKPLEKDVADLYYGYAKESWHKLGGGEKYLDRERSAWKD